jgi:hypothetical protein
VNRAAASIGVASVEREARVMGAAPLLPRDAGCAGPL